MKNLEQRLKDIEAMPQGKEQRDEIIKYMREIESMESKGMRVAIYYIRAFDTYKMYRPKDIPTRFRSYRKR